MGWFLSAQSGDLDEDYLDPPVPAGLAQLSASLKSLAEFMRVDSDLIAAAAASSGTSQVTRHLQVSSFSACGGSTPVMGAGEAPPRRPSVAELLRAAALARADYLDKRAGTEPALWKRLEELVATKQPKRYDEAVGVLADLREFAARKDGADFRWRLEELRAEQTRKLTLIERLQRAGL